MKRKKDSNQLSVLRNNKLIKGAEMGQLLNISRQAYWNKEVGISEFTLSEAYTVSRVLGISLDEFHLALVAYQ